MKRSVAAFSETSSARLRQSGPLTTALCILVLAQSVLAFAPTDIAGLTIWLDGADVAGTGSNPANGTQVGTWVNKAGAFHATQSTASLRPVVASGVVNGRDAVRFTRPAATTARYLGFSHASIATLLNSTNTALVVARANNGGGDNDTNRSMYLFARPGYHSGLTLAGYPSATSAGATRWLGTYSLNISHTLPYTQGEVALLTRVVSGTLAAPPSAIRLALGDAATETLTNTDYALWNHGANANVLRIGCANITGNHTGGLDGDIAEILFYNRALSDAERIQVQSYLNLKWGLLAFAVANPVTGSQQFTATHEVGIVAFPVSSQFDEYQINLSGDEGDLDDEAWLPYDTNSLPATVVFPIPDPEGPVTLHAWLRATNDVPFTNHFESTIEYTTVPPEAQAVSRSYTSLLGRPVRVELADINAGSTGGLANGNPIGIYGIGLSSPEDQTPAATYLSLLPRETPHTVTLSVTNQAGLVDTATAFVTVTATDTAFDLNFTHEKTTAATIGGYNVLGAMTNATAVNRNNTTRGTTIQTSGGDFSTRHVQMFVHSGDGGRIEITPPTAVLDPIQGTDANPGEGRLWVFSFDISLPNIPPWNTLATLTAYTHPRLLLRTNRGGDNQMNDLLRVVFAERGILVQHGDGSVPAIQTVTVNTPYRIVFELDMENDRFRVRAGAISAGESDYLPGQFPFLTGATTKGIGGFWLDGLIAYWEWWQPYTRWDNFQLAASPVPNGIEDFAARDPVTGDPARSSQTTVEIVGELFGPGYTHHILVAESNPVAPADADDPRWTAGAYPASVSLGTPADGDMLTVALWLLDEGGAIQGFSHPILYDSRDPGIANRQVIVTDGLPTVSWTTAMPAGGRVFFGLDDVTEQVSPFLSQTGTVHAVALPGLEPGKTWRYRIEANGALDTEGTFAYLTDTPAIQNVAVNESRFQQITVTWQTDADAIGWVAYGPAGADPVNRTAYGAYGQNHSAVFTGLEPGTEYAVRIHANASRTSRLAARTRSAGAFTLAFEEDTIIASVYGFPITAAYKPDGEMIFPTSYRYGTRPNTAVYPPNSSGHTTQCAMVRMHNGSHGEIKILPPAGHVDPLPGTDRHVPSDPWIFAFDWSGRTQLINTDTSGDARQPQIRLLTNRGGNNTLETLIRVRPSSGNLVLDYRDAGGNPQQQILAQGVTLDRLYRLSFTLNMAASTFTAQVNNTPVGGAYGFLTGATTKGIGGVEVLGDWVSSRNDIMMVDNLRLTGGTPPKGTVLLLR